VSMNVGFGESGFGKGRVARAWDRGDGEALGSRSTGAMPQMDQHLGPYPL
jgi:hypothetical protein